MAVGTAKIFKILIKCIEMYLLSKLKCIYIEMYLLSALKCICIEISALKCICIEMYDLHDLKIALLAFQKLLTNFLFNHWIYCLIIISRLTGSLV